MKRFFYTVFFCAMSLNAQIPDEDFSLNPLFHTPMIPTPPFNWKAEYDNQIADPFIHGEMFSPWHSKGIAYEVSRQSIMGLVHMYKVTKDTGYLETARDQINTMFNSTWFVHCTNGPDDGLKGWGANWTDGLTYITPSIAKNAWQSFSIRVEDIDTTTRMTLTVNGTVLVENTQNHYQSGTIALLSGWAKTSFRNLLVKNLDGTVTYYDLNASASSFSTDWRSVKNENSSYPYDTGDWTCDQSSKIITCDATTNSPTPYFYPYVSGDPDYEDNFGIPADGAANGKYASLALNISNSTSLRNYTIDGQIRVEKRNGGHSEQGVAVRFNADNPTQLFTGRRIHAALPSHRVGVPPPNEPNAGAENSNRNTHFEDYANHIECLFNPNGIQIIDHAFYRGVPFHGGKGDLRMNIKLDELIMYENQGCQGPLEFIYTVYENNVSSLVSDADNFLKIIQDNFVAKWYPKINSDPSNDFFVGGQTNLDFDGDRNRPTTSTDMARCNMLYSGLYKIARDFNSKWRAVSIATPISSLLPDTATLHQFYHDQTYNAARYIISKMWNYPGDDFYQFWSGVYATHEFMTWGTDLNHSGNVVFFLLESYRHGFVTKPEIEKLTRMFTHCIWNQDASLAGIDLSCDMHGNNSAIVNLANYATCSDMYVMLSEIDFKVWEIFDTFLQTAWDTYRISSPKDRFYGIHPALMLYEVKFAKPKNLTATVTGTSVTLSWNHPSDWSAGTRLEHYNVYRREVGQNWSSTPLTVLNTSSTSYTDNGINSSMTCPRLWCQFVI